MEVILEAISKMSALEKERYQNKWNEPETYKGMSVNIVFPEQEKLEMLSVYGQVPRKGDVLSIRGYSIKPDAGYNYGYRNRWKVIEVIYVVSAQDNLKDRLLYSNTYRAEVYVKQHKTLRDAYWAVRGWYYSLKRWLGRK